MTENHGISLDRKVLSIVITWLHRSVVKPVRVFSVCICSRERPNDGNESYIILGFSEKQVCLPASAKMNTEKSANVLTRLPKQSIPIQEKMSFLVPDTPNWTHKQHQKEHHVGFFPLFFLFVRLPVCLAVSRLTVKFTSWAKLESSCQSKQYFIRILFTS